MLLELRLVVGVRRPLLAVRSALVFDVGSAAAAAFSRRLSVLSVLLSLPGSS